MNAKNVDQKIREARQATGITQKELAERIHVTDKAVSKWERVLCFPDLCNLETLACALGLTMEREVYANERRRVEKCGIPLRKSQYMVNGATGFYYPLLSASGRNKGILYALTDEAQYRIMYVEISYYGYYSDIDYTKAIPPDVLPAGFDAGKGNPTQRAFRVMRNFRNGNAHFPGPYGQE